MSLDPSQWRPYGGRRLHGERPEAGQLIGLFYGAWRVMQVRPYLDVDLDDEQRARMTALKPEYRERSRPYHLVLQHVHGPVLTPTKRHHDDTLNASFTVDWGADLRVLTDPYPVCSCHGDLWPCQDYDRDLHAQAAGQQMDRLLATTTPGVCAHCLEPITARQAALTFPEGHLLIPGAPGPTFHIGRGSCWYGATQYEERHRLVALPGVDRVVSCPGKLFTHAADLTTDCSAGPACTDHHGPPTQRRHRYGDCFTRHHYGDEPIPRPTRSCGYPHHGGCLGVEMTDA